MNDFDPTDPYWTHLTPEECQATQAKLDGIRALIAANETRNEWFNHLAAPEDRIPVVITGDELLAILDGGAS